MSMLKDILGLRPKSADSAAIRGALAEAEAALAAARGRAAILEDQRGAILLDGSPAEADAHEASLAGAMAEAGRLAAMCAALPARIAAAEARERAAELDSLADVTEALAAEGAALVPQILRDLAAVAERMRQHDDLTAKVRAAGTELQAGGRQRIELPMRRVWPDPTNATPTTFGFDRLDRGAGTVFFRAPGFDPARAQGSLPRWLAAKAAD